MSDVATLKHSLLNAPWREYTRVSVVGADGPVELVIRRPPDAVLGKLLQGAQALKTTATGAKGQSPEDTAASVELRDVEENLRFRARLVATCVFLPNAVTSLFTPEEVLEWSGAAEVADACMAAINPAKGLEAAKGN